MATRNGSSASTHLQEAMALLIRNQAAFVEQISRNDQERLALQRQAEEWQRKNDERFARIEAWQQKSDERFARIEAQLADLPKRLLQTVLEQLPRIKKEIGFKTPR
jgi:seryl-tRNA synthetase